MEHLPTLSDPAANEHDSGDDVTSNKSFRAAKRPRSTSPPYNSIRRQISTSPLLHNKDRQGNRENIDHSDLNKSGSCGSQSKRRKGSALPVGRTALNSGNKRSQRSPSPVSEEDEDDGTLSSSASTTRSTPVSESTPPREQQLCLQAIDSDQDWEVRQIIGKEDIDGVLHYMVD